MSKAKELADKLMDSRRFCLKADNFAGTWVKKRAADEDKREQLEAMLEAVLEALGTESGPSVTADPIAVELAKRKANRAPEAVDADTPLTEAEAQAIRETVKPVTEADLQGAVDLAIKEAIKPIWATAPMDGARMAKKFSVKAVRNGVTVSTQQDRWEKGLQAAGLPGTVSFAYAGLGIEAGGSGDRDCHIVYIG